MTSGFRHAVSAPMPKPASVILAQRCLVIINAQDVVVETAATAAEEQNGYGRIAGCRV